MSRSPMPSSLFAELTPNSGTQERVVGQRAVKPAAAGVAKSREGRVSRGGKVHMKVIDL